MPKIKVSPFAIALSFLIAYSMPCNMLFSYIISVIFHELGHIIAACVCGSRIDSIVFSPLGITINRAGCTTSHISDIMIYISGPIFSLLLGICGIIFSNSYIAVFSFALLILNLLPVKVFDGGKIFASLLNIFAPALSDTIVKTVSAVCIFVMWIIAVYILIMTSSFSLFILCFYLFFAIFV